MFFFNDQPLSVVDNGKGIVRKVLSYEGKMMAVLNEFKTNAVGELHSHPHEQITYELSGRFRFTIDGVER